MILSPFQNEGHRWSIVIPTMAQPESSHVKKMIVSPYCLLLALDGIPEKSQNQKELGVATISTSESQSMSTQAEPYGKAAPQRNEPHVSALYPDLFRGAAGGAMPHAQWDGVFLANSHSQEWGALHKLPECLATQRKV